MTQGSDPSPAAEGPYRAMARLYDQQLRLFAAHYSNMWDGRSNSAAVVAAYFHELVDLSRPALFVEAGAYRAEASRRTREQHPDCRVVAFEANPYNHEKYADELGFVDLDIEYLNLALTESAGPVTFHLRTRQDGKDLRKTTGNSSLLRMRGTDTQYEEISVDGVTLDGFFADSTAGPVCLWIDVEGASRQVLNGARGLLTRTELVLIEVEEVFRWEDQWRSLDVIEFFLEAGFLPLTRDAEYNQHYNIIFVRTDVYERPDVLWSHELHTNYVTQHMGVRHAQERPDTDSADPADSTRPGRRRGPWGRSSPGS
jgi:FkbM family methyltransferase